jgi:hypothetical protein
MVADDKSAASGTTTTTQAKKEQQKFAEEVLHPRWIAIRRQRLWAKTLLDIKEAVANSLGECCDSFRHIIGDELFASITERQRPLIESRLKHLRSSRASEAQWEADLWRQWFFKNTLQTPDCDPVESKPFMGRIVQARMPFSGDGAVLPPLLASEGDRRESGLYVARVPWDPDLKIQKGNRVLWYPDYLYAVSLSSLRHRLRGFCQPFIAALPAFRLAQNEYLPGNWIAEIKAEDTESNHLAAENYCALMSAYLLHERLILRWITKNSTVQSNNPVELDDSLAVHCITCCGPRCKIFRMSIREKDTPSDIEPVRYDMEKLDEFSIETKYGDEQLCDWINTLNALALTAQFKSLIMDINAVQALPTPPASCSDSWTSKIGFVYRTGSQKEICVKQLDDLRKAYTQGEIKAEQTIGDKAIQWDEKGQAVEVDIEKPKLHQISETAQDSDMPATIQKIWTAKFTESELLQLRASSVDLIARVLSKDLGPGDSSKKEKIQNILTAQNTLDSGRWLALGVWKEIISVGDLSQLRSETLQTICKDLGIKFDITARKADLTTALKLWAG